MELTIPIVCTIISVVFCVATFVTNRMDKAKSNAKEDNKGIIEYRLNQVEIKLDKILEKLDKYDEEIDTKIDKAIKNHIQLYHQKS